MKKRFSAIIAYTNNTCLCNVFYRAQGLSVKEIFMLDLDRFFICLSTAIEYHQLGFFFEEGGCFGMAYSLHQFFEKHGYTTSIHCTDSAFVHAWVVLPDGSCFDHQGLLYSPPLFSQMLSISELLIFAKNHGHSDEHWWHSVYTAEEVLSSAEKLYEDEIALPSSGMQF